jgi:hypothetical protein
MSMMGSGPPWSVCVEVKLVRMTPLTLTSTSLVGDDDLAIEHRMRW